MTYCVLDRAGRPDWCIHMQQLDERRTRLSEDINTREQLMRRSQNTRMHDVVTDKLASKRATLAIVEHQLDKYASRRLRAAVHAPKVLASRGKNATS